METKSNFLRNALLLVCVSALGYGFVRYYRHVHRDDLPELAYPELDSTRKAGTFSTLVRGGAYSRSALPEEIANPFRTVNLPAGSLLPAFAPIAAGSPMFLGTYYKVDEHADLSGQTIGNFFVDFERGGEFIIEDARSNFARDEHTLTIIMKKGLMRIKPYDYDHGKFALLIRTPFANIVGIRPEIGIEIAENGHGRIWPMSGEVVAITSDGTHRRLNIKGLNDL